MRKIDQIVNCLLDRVILKTSNREIWLGIAKAIESVLEYDYAAILLLSLVDDQHCTRLHHAKYQKYIPIIPLIDRFVRKPVDP